MESIYIIGIVLMVVILLIIIGCLIYQVENLEKKVKNIDSIERTLVMHNEAIALLSQTDQNILQTIQELQKPK